MLADNDPTLDDDDSVNSRVALVAFAGDQDSQDSDDIVGHHGVQHQRDRASKSYRCLSDSLYTTTSRAPGALNVIGASPSRPTYVLMMSDGEPTPAARREARRPRPQSRA
jgi:hypothetical protein